MMQKTLSAAIMKKSTNKIYLEITRDNFESFCNTVGLFKPEFLRTLKKSEADHKAGRVTKRKSLYELIEKS